MTSTTQPKTKFAFSASDRRYRLLMLVAAIAYSAICLPHFIEIKDWYRAFGTLVVSGLFLTIRHHVWRIESKKAEVLSIISDFKGSVNLMGRVSDGAHIAILELEKILNKRYADDSILPLVDAYPHLTRAEIERRLNILVDKRNKDFEQWKAEEMRKPMP